MEKVQFVINGVKYAVGSEVSSDETLLEFLRERAELRGTKYMCREAGCGACVVAAKRDGKTISVNSCMVSVTSCQDWEITTVEEVGNKLQGYHPVQTTLAKYNGTQCGYCSPGWVMAMYCLLKSRKNMTMLEIENTFGSNVCRCTGYRPILDAYKTFGIDSPMRSEKPIDMKDITDIEDVTTCKKDCENSKCKYFDWCIISKEDVEKTNILEINLLDGKKWFRVHVIADIFSVLSKYYDDKSYMLVAGNTAKGAYPIFEYPDILIDISAIYELKGFYLDQNLVIGAGSTLTETLDLFHSMQKNQYFSYLRQFYDHLLLVAHIPVRNIGTIAGNLMIKHQHNDFPSDIFLLLETVGAQMTIVSLKHGKEVITMETFLRTDMTRKVIVNVMLPPLSYQHHVVTFKIMPRSQNAHAIVNAGFLYELDHNSNVIQSRIVYGGLSPSFTRAIATEAFLLQKPLFTNLTLQSAVLLLKEELKVTENPPEPSTNYRKQLAVNLFYKGLLTLCPKSLLDPRYQSGITRIREARGLSEGRQLFDTNPLLWPLTKPIPKLEALIQCSGEAPYTEDLPSLPKEVFAAFVLSTVAKGNIVSIDPAQALRMHGVIAFYSANDIPGQNSFIELREPFYVGSEEILCSGNVQHYNQPIGIIVAETRPIAERAKNLVKVTYTNVRKPVIDVEEAKKDMKRNILYTTRTATEEGTDIAKVIKGTQNIYDQYHFTMETLVCVTNPSEQGLNVYAASQWLDGVQVATAKALNIDQNRVDVFSTRVGGAYGYKLTRESQVAVACSLVAYKLNRPCRFIQALSSNTRAMGKRFSCSSDYEISVNRLGVIQKLSEKIYEDNGYKVTELLSKLGADVYNNCYNPSRWDYTCYNTLTDKAKNTWFRAPGTLENIAMVETIMERISYELSLDPLETRLRNLAEDYRSDVTEMIASLKDKAQYLERREAVDKFNIQNRWKKRGLRASVMRFSFESTGVYDVDMSVYNSDGTVVLTYGGIEMGQGLNTKAVQVCAYLLNIPISKIQTKGNNTIINPNNTNSAGSYTSPGIVDGVRKCCEILLERLKPIRAQLVNPTWEQIIRRADELETDLKVHSFINTTDKQTYDIFAVNLSEVEIDVLTGELQVLRVDLLQDVGQSISPEIDIGQVEGALIMGLGYWTTEHLVYSEKGEVLTDRTWNYYVPQARDIPQDFRIYFRKKYKTDNAVFGSKTTGEPSTCLAVSVAFAIREAITAARLESGHSTTEWCQIDGPFTAETIYLSTATSCKDLKFN